MVKGVPMEALLDTGSLQTLVRREFVPEGKVLVGKAVVVDMPMVSVFANLLQSWT